MEMLHTISANMNAMESSIKQDTQDQINYLRESVEESISSNAAVKDEKIEQPANATDTLADILQRFRLTRIPTINPAQIHRAHPRDLYQADRTLQAQFTLNNGNR